ncbi:cellulase family glycosylhydrolase [Dubosiella newyorkensis]|uniref:Endoglucanase n=2 Tax=Dubosiella newyorkensis TaxID=1862672 RepID=A0A1U7NKP8_9FIRM|nr:cellulase family glycosylhydrolase [Dubosiella newyorkensis]OLU44989.1 hypothetical protein BO225_09350 [Dubosiella newyorkensis]
MKTKHAIYLVLTIFLAFLFMNGEPMIVKAQQSDQEMNPKLSTEKNASLELKSMIEQELYHQRKDQPTPKIASLKIQNNRIVDQKGKPFVLKGISTHGIAWFPEIINQNSFTRFRDDFGLNTVRIAMYTAEDGGYCTGGDQQNLESRIDQGVQLCQQLNLYCIIDWHILSDQDPLQYKDQSKLFFEKMAQKYGKTPNVIFEICNEPNGNTTWNDVTQYANQIIPAIREHSNNLIIVGTPTWSQDIDQAARKPLKYSNIAYALHFYAATHKDDLRNKYLQNVNKIPIIVSEYGICDASGNGNIDEANAKQWIDLLNKNQTGRILWNASNKQETSSILVPDANMETWSLSDLSPTGHWLLDQANQKKPIKSEKKAEARAKLTTTFQETNHWENGNQYSMQYLASIQNNTNKTASSWRFEIKFPEPVQIDDYWNCEIEHIDQRTFIFSNKEYNSKIKAEDSIQDIGCIVTSDSLIDPKTIQINP